MANIKGLKQTYYNNADDSKVNKWVYKSAKYFYLVPISMQYQVHCAPDQDREGLRNVSNI